MLCLQADSQTYIILLISDLQCHKPTFFQQNKFAALVAESWHIRATPTELSLIRGVRTLKADFGGKITKK